MKRSLLCLALISTALAQQNTTDSNVTVPTNLTTSNTTSQSLAPTTNAPTLSPSKSARPTDTPSASPTFEPTISPPPSFVPTISSIPTSSPSLTPTGTPVIPPSSAPSTEGLLEVFSKYRQIIQVSVSSKFDESQLNRFQKVYEEQTQNFGYYVGKPNIMTTCEVKNQTLSESRRRLWDIVSPPRMLQIQPTNYALDMEFFMKYSTKNGIYDINDYNEEFMDYVNLNTTIIVDSMIGLELPVVSMSNVTMLYIAVQPTIAPHARPSQPPTKNPSNFIEIPEVNKNSFVLGLSLGLSGAFAVAAFGFFYYRHSERSKQDDEIVEMDPVGDNADMDIEGGESMEMKLSDHEAGVMVGVTNSSQHDIDSDDSENEVVGGLRDNVTGSLGTAREAANVQSSQLSLRQSAPSRLRSVSPHDLENGVNSSVALSLPPMVHPFAYATMDSSQEVSQAVQTQVAQLQAQEQYQDTFPPAPANTMADFSFSSDSEDEMGNPSAFDGSHDELDNYKNHDLEVLRNAVEETVDDVEGMLSLAMTRALTEADDTVLPWGSGDSGSIEASCLFETYDWLKRHEESQLATRNDFFQEVINGIVMTVLFGLLHPLEAAQLAHGVATVIGLPLLKDLPVKTLIITGMRKTNDAAFGRHVMLAAFERFGPIEQAAIAGGRGFGFVRFARPKSVQRALEKYRVAEIEIQDVSVSIKTLENTAPSSG